MLFTDASTHGWGAELGDLSINRQWYAAQCHLNILEMEAVIYTIKGFLNRLHVSVVDLMCDIATVFVYQTGRWDQAIQTNMADNQVS